MDFFCDALDKGLCFSGQAPTSYCINFLMQVLELGSFFQNGKPGAQIPILLWLCWGQHMTYIGIA